MKVIIKDFDYNGKHYDTYECDIENAEHMTDVEITKCICALLDNKLNVEDFPKISFSDEIKTIDLNEIGEHVSVWGNTFATITEEHIDAMRKGKIIYVDDGEYCHFFRFVKGVEDETET